MTASLAHGPELRASGARFRRALLEPGEVQARVLHGILERNAACAYARRYDFASIRDARAFRDRVPVVRYEDLRPDFERIEQGETGVLTVEPVVACEQTGGSSAGAKLVPYTRSGLNEFQAGLLPWLDALYTVSPEAARGRAYWSISPACRVPRSTAGGIPVGLPSDAAYFGDSLAARLIGSLAVPPEVGRLSHVALWRRVTLLHLVACEDLTLVSVWSPTFLLDLLATLQHEADDIATGLACGSLGMPERGRSLEALALPAPNPERARELLRAMRCNPVDWHRLWPRLAVISCWDQAQARPYAADLRRMFAGTFVQGKGLLATEGLVSIPVDATAEPVLALESGYFEFVDACGRALSVTELEIGAEYELLLTTSSGLYRYAIGDRVRVTGRVERTPTLQFLGRTGVSCDLCGEKLDEAFVSGAIAVAAVRFALLVPQRDPLCYELIVDAQELSAEAAVRAASVIEHVLRANPQYDYARRLGQLAPVRAIRVIAPLASWIARGLARGQHLGDIKLTALYPHEDWPTIFRAPA